MLNFLKIFYGSSIWWTLSNASLLGDLGNLLLLGGISAVGENLELCGLGLPEIAKKYGYAAETLSATTEDGYIITIHRIHSLTAFNGTLKPVVLWHGLMADSKCFVVNYRNQCLPFLLADQGYDVYLPNARGNGQSQDYVNESRNSNNIFDAYWRFSWDQIAQFDVKSAVNKVLDYTQDSQVIYIGHSQGTTTMFACLSEDEAFNDKIALFVALAPVTYFSHTGSLLYKGASFIEPFLDLLYGTKFSNSSQLQSLLVLAGCTPLAEICKSLLFLAYGESKHLDNSRLPLYTCSSPASFSWGQFLQYAQLAKSKLNKFQKYDFGARKNREKYGQLTPPEYDVTKITAEIAIYVSENDLTTNDADYQILKSKLNTLIYEKYLRADTGYSHLDFIWGDNVAEVVYFDLIRLIGGY